MELPCKDCITLPVCKARFYKTNLGTCCLLKNYIMGDYRNAVPYWVERFKRERSVATFFNELGRKNE